MDFADRCIAFLFELISKIACYIVDLKESDDCRYWLGPVCVIPMCLIMVLICIIWLASTIIQHYVFSVSVVAVLYIGHKFFEHINKPEPSSASKWTWVKWRGRWVLVADYDITNVNNLAAAA